MRKVVVYEIVSLDGVAEEPDSFFGWDDVMDANLDAVIATQDAVVLGRRSFETSPTGHLLVDYRVLPASEESS